MNKQSIHPSVQKELEVIEFLNIYLPHCTSKTRTIVNAGGCGVYASILYNELVKLGITPKIIALCDLNEDGPDSESQDTLNKRYSNFANFLKSGEVKLPMSPSHIVIQLDREIYFDSEGILSGIKALCYPKKVEITKEKLDELVEKSDWNPIFDRDCVPEITEYLSKISEEFLLWKDGKEYKFVGGTFTDKTVTAREMQDNPLSRLFASM